MPGQRHPRPPCRAAATCTQPCASPVPPTRWRPCRDAARKLPPAQAGHHGRCQLFQLATRSAWRPAVGRLYHPGYVAKRMEIARRCGNATPADHVRRETPEAGDVVVLLGAAAPAVTACHGRLKGTAWVAGALRRRGAEGQPARGAQDPAPLPPRGGRASKVNDFGAGACPSPSANLRINLNWVPKKYEGPGRTELAISVPGRMATPSPPPTSTSCAMHEETSRPPWSPRSPTMRVRVVMERQRHHRPQREFLASTARRSAGRHRPARAPTSARGKGETSWRMNALVTDLNVARTRACRALRLHHRRGHDARRRQRTSALDARAGHGRNAAAWAARPPRASGMAWGINLTKVSTSSPAPTTAVVNRSLAVAAGFQRMDMRLTFPSISKACATRSAEENPAAVVGALRAQVDLGIGSIGGKDSCGTLRAISTCRPRSCRSPRRWRVRSSDVSSSRVPVIAWRWLPARCYGRGHRAASRMRWNGRLAHRRRWTPLCRSLRCVWATAERDVDAMRYSSCVRQLPLWSWPAQEPA